MYAFVFHVLAVDLQLLLLLWSVNDRRENDVDDDRHADIDITDVTSSRSQMLHVQFTLFQIAYRLPVKYLSCTKNLYVACILSSLGLRALLSLVSDVDTTG